MKVYQRDIFFEAVKALGNPRPKILPDNFKGQGIKEGFIYDKWFTGINCYLFGVTQKNTGEAHFEIVPKYIVGKGDKKRVLSPWEEPVCNEIETFNSHFRATDRFYELHKEIGY